MSAENGLTATERKKQAKPKAKERGRLEKREAWEREQQAKREANQREQLAKREAKEREQLAKREAKQLHADAEKWLLEIANEHLSLSQSDLTIQSVWREKEDERLILGLCLYGFENGKKCNPSSGHVPTGK